MPGLATHASTPYAGSSAIDSYVAIHHGLRRLQEPRNTTVEPLMREYPVAYPISVGRLRSGDWSSSVPDLLVAEGRMGTRISEDPADARLELEHEIAEVSDRDPFLRDLVSTACEDATRLPRPRERAAPYGSDLRLYHAAGIPTLHYGPGDVRLAHGPDESVPIGEVLDVARTLVISILRSCGTVG